MANFGDKFKKLRIEKGVTQKQIAEYLKIATNNYQNFEYGKIKPSLENLIALADYFNVSIDYLTGRTDNPEINK